MKKKLFTMILAGVIGFSFMAAGCGNKKDSQEKGQAGSSPTAEASETPEPTKEPTETPAALKPIGTEEAGAYEVQLTNGTGKNITGIAIKRMEDGEYPENMLGADDTFAVNEERILYYKGESGSQSDNAGQDTADQGTDSENLLTPGYDIQLSFEEGTALELHAFPFGDIEKGSIRLEDEVAFIVYDSMADKKEVSTKEAEQVIAEQKKAEAAEQEAGAGTSEEQYNSEPAYEEPVYQEPVYEEPVYQEPVYEEPVYQEPAGGGDGGGDACLEGGLVF